MQFHDLPGYGKVAEKSAKNFFTAYVARDIGDSWA